MVKKRTIQRFVSMLLAIMLMLCTSVMTVSAITYKLSVSDQALWEASEDLGTAATELGLTNSGGTLTFDSSGFIESTDKEQKAKIKNFMSATIAAGISTDGTTTIMDVLNADENIDMSVYLVPYMFDELRGDVIGGAKVISPIIPVINVVIGIGAIVVLALLVLHSVYDLLIIVVPFLRTKISTGKDGESKSQRPAYVSEAAWSAIVASESAITGDGSGYKSALWVYFKRRLPEYIVIVVIIAFLLLGGFSNLIQALLNLGSSYTG